MARITRLERGRRHAGCRACGDALAGQVVYEVDGYRVGPPACPACDDRLAIVISFVATPMPGRDVPPSSPDDRDRLVAVLAR